MESTAKKLSTCKARALAGHEGRINTLSWSPDGSSLASGSSDTSIKIWQVGHTGQTREVQQLRDHKKNVEQVRWMDRQRLLSTSEDKTVKLWDARSGKCTDTFSINSTSINLACSPGEHYFAVGDSKDVVTLFDVRKREVVDSKEVGAELGCQVNEFAWDPTGTYLFLTTGFTSLSRGGFELFSTKNGTLEHIHSFLGHSGSCFCISFAHGGKGMFALGAMDGLVSLWDTRSLACIRSFSRSDTAIRGAGFNADGSILAYGSQDKVLYLDNVETGEPLAEIDSSALESVATMAWHPKENILAICGDEPKGTKMGFVRVVGEYFS